jgi:membrane associated rhomboid family serine protease
MYVSALLVCLLPTFAKHKDDYYYRSLGASGAVSAVVFAYILLFPTQGLGLVFLPGLYIPGFIFGTIYLVVSSFLGRKGMGNINHSAHIWGSIYGFAFLIVAAQIFSHYPVLSSFLSQVKDYLAGL